jgi:hypothetical protein
MISKSYVMKWVEHVLCNAHFCYSVMLDLCRQFTFVSISIKPCKTYLVGVKVNLQCDDLCYAWSIGFIFTWFHNAYKIL